MLKLITISTLLGTFFLSTISCKKDDKENNEDKTFTDLRDGNVYKTVTIGTQVWMAENLRYLPNVFRPEAGSTIAFHYYVYGYDGTNITEAKATSNYTTYGVLYNWPAAMNACPSGWHLPSDDEWTTLEEYLGNDFLTGGKLKETGTTHWSSPNLGATNKSGFTALPGGYRSSNGTFCCLSYEGGWWSATDNFDVAWWRGLNYNFSTIGMTEYNKEYGFSIRCIKD